jgi:hypothetical protein
MRVQRYVYSHYHILECIQWRSVYLLLECNTICTVKGGFFMSSELYDCYFTFFDKSLSFHSLLRKEDFTPVRLNKNKFI